MRWQVLPAVLCFCVSGLLVAAISPGGVGTPASTMPPLPDLGQSRVLTGHTHTAPITSFAWSPLRQPNQPTRTAARAASDVPELSLRVTDLALTVPAVVPAGRIVITVENASFQPEEVILARLPQGLTMQAALAAPDATALPCLLQATYLGSPSAAPPGRQTTALVDLVSRQYIAFTADEQLLYTIDRHRLMAGFVVTARPGSAAGTAPRADATITLADDAIGGLAPLPLAPGQHIWRVVNTGQHLHELRLFRAPGPLTVGQIQAAIAATDPTKSVTAASGGLNFESFMALPPAGGVGWLSPRHTAWTMVELPPGTYLAVDLVRSPATDEPYALYGVATVVTVR